jgi:hypothetical protein
LYNAQSTLQEKGKNGKNNPEPQAGSSKNRNHHYRCCVAVVLCCCCLVTGRWRILYVSGICASAADVEEFQNFEIPEFPTAMPFDQNDPGSENEDFTIPEFDFGGEVPPGRAG